MRQRVLPVSTLSGYKMY